MLSVWSETYFEQLLLGRLVVRTKESGVFESVYEPLLARDLSLLYSMFDPTTVTLVLSFSALFYAYLLFDMVGDTAGWRLALIAPCVLSAVTALIVAAWRLGMVDRAMGAFGPFPRPLSLLSHASADPLKKRLVEKDRHSSKAGAALDLQRHAKHPISSSGKPRASHSSSRERSGGVLEDDL